MKNKYIVRQNDIKDCGVCCLESILKYYDGYIPLETLRIDTNTSINGTTAYNIIKTAKKYGLSGKGKKTDNLYDIHLPAIAHLKLNNGLNHFVVIYKITSNNITIMDPGKGYKKYKTEEFLKIWTKVILEFVPYKKIPYIKTNNKISSLFINTIAEEKNLFKNLLLNNIVLIIISIIISYYFKIISSSIESNHNKTKIFIILFFIILNVTKIILNYIKNENIIYLEKNIDLTIILDLISHIFKLPLNVIKSRSSGEILTRVNEFYNIKSLFIEIISSLLPDLILAICSVYFLYSTSAELFLILCIISVLYILLGLITSPIIYQKINDNIDLETEFNGNLIEKVEGIESIKNINKTNYFLNKINKNYLLFKQNDLSYKNYLNKVQIIKDFVYELGTFIITSIGFILIMKNKLSLINLITFNTLLSYFMNPIINTINLIPSIYFIKLSIIKTTEFYQIKQEENKEEEFVNGNIILNNIKYSYSDFNELLKNVNIKINKNEHLHLVGESGCGKSTLCKLLVRNIEDYKGNITIGDVNIKDYKINTIRKNITYISQREKLFTDTISANIILNNNISKKELNKIINITNINKILETKELSLDTYLFDGGYNLSGGERQRIVLARALVQKPDILIMDESLSELDKKTEKDILRKLDKNYKDMTIIYISHSNTRYFKKIIRIGN